MRTRKPSDTLPVPVSRALRKLGNDIKDARRRRRIPTKIAAERASISRTTLVKIEKGQPGVAIGNYASVLFVLGMQAAAARQHGADLPHHLDLPFREIVLRFLRLFCQTPYFL